MCLIALAVNAAPGLPLVIAANRDEFFKRPSASARWWADSPRIFAGRDLEGHGTWMGVTRGGRVAAVTNYRDPSIQVEEPRSRGAAVRAFLEGDEAPGDFLAALATEAHRYSPFSLLVGVPGDLRCLSSVTGDITRVPQGIHGLSNHLLNTPWPKVRRLREGMAVALEGPAEGLDARLLEILSDPGPAPASELPATGIPPALEAGLSPIFVSLPGYGTRSSTVMILRDDGVMSLREVTWSPGGEPGGEVRESFPISGAAP